MSYMQENPLILCVIYGTNTLCVYYIWDKSIMCVLCMGQEHYVCIMYGTGTLCVYYGTSTLCVYHIWDM